MLNEIKRKKREEGREYHELSLEAALQKGIVKAKSCGTLTCEICKVEVRIWNQHSRSEHHRKEKLKKDEKYEENREEEKDAKKMEEEKQEEVKEKEEKEESEVTMEELEEMLFSLEAQPGSKEEGEKRASYFLQQARKFAQEIEV